jgi:2,4-dienoyl-CoA reductase-like NADH-dependent reductase (Old Yellow Enzyme family)
VVLQKGTDLTPFRKWAELGKAGGGQFWLQISHPGRQLYKATGETAVSPSGISLDMGKLSSMFAPVRKLEEAEIEAIITRFADTAEQAEAAGFDGVQIHSAHGYLSSQFLSPLNNKRDDKWGGSLDNRARFLRAIIEAARARVKPGFGIGVKLNSADFQRGGFDFDDARQVVEWMKGRGVDFVELSGGSYESPAMMGSDADGAEVRSTSTSQREAYFVDFARDMAKVASMPIMVTGGITKRATAEEALEQDAAGFGVQMLGIARAMAFIPDLPGDWEADRSLEFTMPEPNWKNTSLKGLANMSVTKAQLELMAQGKPANPNVSPVFSMIADQWKTAGRAKRYRKWREGNG